MSKKKREKLLINQGNQCFFCKQQIPKNEATIEHLVAKSNGGGNEEENCVVCCRTLNFQLGNKPLKEKIQMAMSHQGRFICPNAGGSNERFNLVFSFLKSKSTELRPKKINSLRNFIHENIFHGKLDQSYADEAIEWLCSTGRILLNEQGLTYNLKTKSLKTSWS